MLGSSVLSLSIYSNVSVVLYIFLFFNIFCVASLVWFQFLNFCVPLKFYGMYLVAPLVNGPLWGGGIWVCGEIFYCYFILVCNSVILGSCFVYTATIIGVILI